jgi:hypothetical protein
MYTREMPGKLPEFSVLTAQIFQIPFTESAIVYTDKEEQINTQYWAVDSVLEM